MSEDGESSPPEDKVEIWQGSGSSVPQHPSPPPPAPSDNSSVTTKAPAQKIPVVSSSELIVEEPLEPALLSSNNGSSSDTPHTSDSTSSSITTTVSPTNVTTSDGSVSVKGREQTTIVQLDSELHLFSDSDVPLILDTSHPFGYIVGRKPRRGAGRLNEKLNEKLNE